jgi:hypothetical protein
VERRTEEVALGAFDGPRLVDYGERGASSTPRFTVTVTSGAAWATVWITEDEARRLAAELAARLSLRSQALAPGG